MELIALMVVVGEPKYYKVFYWRKYFFFFLNVFLLKVSLMGKEFDAFNTESSKNFLIKLLKNSQVKKAYNLVMIK